MQARTCPDSRRQTQRKDNDNNPIYNYEFVAVCTAAGLGCDGKPDPAVETAFADVWLEFQFIEYDSRSSDEKGPHLFYKVPRGLRRAEVVVDGWLQIMHVPARPPHGPDP